MRSAAAEHLCQRPGDQGLIHCQHTVGDCLIYQSTSPRHGGWPTLTEPALPRTHQPWPPVAGPRVHSLLHQLRHWRGAEADAALALPGCQATGSTRPVARGGRRAPTRARAQHSCQLLSSADAHSRVRHCTAGLLLHAAGRLSARVVDWQARTRPARTGMGGRGEVEGGIAGDGSRACYAGQSLQDPSTGSVSCIRACTVGDSTNTNCSDTSTCTVTGACAGTVGATVPQVPSPSQLQAAARRRRPCPML
jgi:hypothetical protein